jgi:hypothetical protein
MVYTKKLAIILFLTIQVVGIQAQKIWENPKYGTDSISRMECAKNLSTMNEFVRINLFDYAYDGWAYAYNNCPGSSKNIYIYGEKILDHKITNAETDEENKAFVDSLMSMFDKRIEHFDQEFYVLGKKGIALIKYDPERLEEGYGILSKSIELGGNKSSEAVFVTHVQASLRLFKSEDISSDQFIGDYLNAVELLESDPRKSLRTEQAIETIEQMFAESGAADCQSLTGIFTAKFEAAPEDIDLLKKITGLLGDNKCQETELFARASEKLYALEPSAEAAFNLARLFKERKQYEKARDYYLKAINDQNDGSKKANYYIELASLMMDDMSDKPEARKYALKALDHNPNLGLAYIIIGNAYVSSTEQCGSNSFEKATLYLVAVDKYAKAKSVDPSITERANRLIERYSAYFPNNEDAFFHGYTDGDKYTVGCWINETTTIRTRKNG